MEQKSLINYTKEAFTLPINLAFLMFMITTVIGFSIVAGSFTTPILIVSALGAAAEMAYLAYMPTNKRFVRAVNARYQTVLNNLERQYLSFKYLQQLGKDYLDRYMSFYHKKQLVTENLLKNQDKTGSLDYSYIEKLHSLESYYVELLYGLEQYEKYNKSGSQEQLVAEMSKIRLEMENASEAVRNQYKRRLNVLQKRTEKLMEAKEKMQVARIQIDTLEDTMNYIVDQSLTLKNPNEIGRAIDEIITNAEQHHSTIEELDRVLSEINLPSVSLSSDKQDEEAYYNSGIQNPIL